jgi:hypothetical protein
MYIYLHIIITQNTHTSLISNLPMVRMEKIEQKELCKNYKLARGFHDLHDLVVTYTKKNVLPNFFLSLSL